MISMTWLACHYRAGENTEPKFWFPWKKKTHVEETQRLNCQNQWWIALFGFFLPILRHHMQGKFNKSITVYFLPSCFYPIMHFSRGRLQSTMECLAKLFHFNAPVKWNSHLPPSGQGQELCMGEWMPYWTKLLPRMGRVIDNYWTPTLTCWGQHGEFDMQRRNW